MIDLNAINRVQSNITNFNSVSNTTSNVNNFSSTINGIGVTSYEDIFNEASQTYGVPVELLKAIAKAESNFNADAQSSAGAQGVMQLMPATAKSLGVTDSFDAYQNIMGGSKYIGELLTKYDGDVTLALAGYNAGMGNVAKYGGVPPFQETQNYIVKVMDYAKLDLDANYNYTGNSNVNTSNNISTSTSYNNFTTGFNSITETTSNSSSFDMSEYINNYAKNFVTATENNVQSLISSIGRYNSSDYSSLASTDSSSSNNSYISSIFADDSVESNIINFDTFSMSDYLNFVDTLMVDMDSPYTAEYVEDILKSKIKF